jgi:hypothetical protein
MPANLAQLPMMAAEYLGSMFLSALLITFQLFMTERNGISSSLNCDNTEPINKYLIVAIDISYKVKSLMDKKK